MKKLKIKFLQPFYLVVLLCSCSLTPDYSAPAVDLPDHWQAVLDLPEIPAGEMLSQYWQQLNDPVLNLLVKEASTKNFTLAEAAHRIDEALAFAGLRSAEYFPDFDLNADARLRRRSRAIASAIADARNDFYSVGGLLTWELDLFGRIRSLNQSAQAALEASAEGYRSVLVTINAEVVSSYIRYRTFEQQIRLTAKNIRQQKESLELSRFRFNAGLAPELDIYQAESNLGQTEATLPSLRILITRELNLLAVLTARYPDELKIILDGEDKNKKVLSTQLLQLDTLQLPYNIIRQRPDLRESERSIAAQYALIGATKAELYPIVTLPGFFSFESLNSLSSAFDSSSLAFSIGSSIRQNFFDFGRVRQQINIADARTKQLVATYHQGVLQAVREVEDAAIGLVEEKNRIRQLSSSVQASEQATALVKDLYAAGLTDFQNVLDSEQRQFNQEIDLAESRGNRLVAFVDLFRALGGGWQDSSEPSPPVRSDQSIK